MLGVDRPGGRVGGGVRGEGRIRYSTSRRAPDRVGWQLASSLPEIDKS